MLYEDEIVGYGAPEKAAAVAEKLPQKESPDVGKGVLLLLRDIAIAFAVIILLLQFIKPTIVFEHSMENTLHPEDYVFLSRQAYHFGEVEYGDIIVFESILLDDQGNSKNLIKRVIGKPGDTIEIKEDAVWRNGERLIEPYTKDGVTTGEMALLTVPADSYFVLGDNRLVSKDSRSSGVGFVRADTIKGKVIFRLFPLSSTGSIH